MELLDDVVGEILLRFPPADPASLVRAALVCKSWCRIVCDPSFRRQFVEFHRVAPLLGFLCSSMDAGSIFFPTSSLSSLPLPLDDYYEEVRDCVALDARHGLVLLHLTLGDDKDILIIWDPTTSDWWEIPVLDICEPCYWYATVLRAPTASGASGACGLLDCQVPFIVVRLVTHLVTDQGSQPEHFFRVYSSVATSWSEQILVPGCSVGLVCTALVGNTLYFLVDFGFRVLGFDLATKETSVIDLIPPEIADATVLMEMEGGGLGFARLDGADDRLYLWSMEVNPKGDMGWTQIRVIDLQKLLPVDDCSIFRSDDCSNFITFLAFAHGLDVFFVATNDKRLFIFDLKSETLREAGDQYDLFSRYHRIVPYTSFCTPALRLVATGEEPEVDDLVKNGVEEVLGLGELRNFEKKGLENLKGELKYSIEKGIKHPQELGNLPGF